jgi:hypothetical protein
LISGSDTTILAVAVKLIADSSRFLRQGNPGQDD